MFTHKELHDSAERLYKAGKWTCLDLPPEVQKRLWEELRDALGLPIGTATELGVGDKNEGE